MMIGIERRPLTITEMISHRVERDEGRTVEVFVANMEFSGQFFHSYWHFSLYGIMVSIILVILFKQPFSPLIMKFAIETNLEEARSMIEPPRNYILITIVGVHLVCLILIVSRIFTERKKILKHSDFYNFSI